MRVRTLVAVVVTIAVVAAGAGAVWLYSDRQSPSAGPGEPSATPPAPTVPVPPPDELDLPDARQPQAVLEDTGGATIPPGAVRQQLARLLEDKDLGRHVGVLVRDLDSGDDELSIGGSGRFTPASTLKLFTGAAILSLLGPEHRFETTVVLDRSGGGPPRAVLVGGGDPLLARTQSDPDAGYAPDVSAVASVDRLARRTAQALRTGGIRQVRVGWDESLFTGPAVSPRWERSYIPDEVVSRTSALWVNEGRLGYGYSGRSREPAAAAAEKFAKVLERRGVTVRGAPASAPLREPPTDGEAAGGVLARAESAPLDEIVQHVLTVSDNEGAEVLLRHVGLASDRAGSFRGGAAGMRVTLTRLGVPWRGVDVYDGSGLSRDNRVTLAAELAVLELGADPDQPDLRTVVAGLPVAGFSGSLASRFLDAASAAARGVVRAKTGTLTGVHGLAGVVVSRDDSLLGFALLLDRVRPVDTFGARLTLDRLTSALARCGCSPRR